MARTMEAMGQCMRSFKVVPLSELIEDGFIPGLMVCEEYYEPPRLLQSAAIKAEDFSLNAPVRFTYRIAATLPAWDADAQVYQSVPYCLSSIDIPGFVVVESGALAFLQNEDGSYIRASDGHGYLTAES